jgi:hypothetical protein
VAAAAASDVQTLEAAGYSVTWIRRMPAIYTAEVTQGSKTGLNLAGGRLSGLYSELELERQNGNSGSKGFRLERLQVAVFDSHRLLKGRLGRAS